MTPLRFSVLCVAAVTLVGCSREATFVEPIGPLARIHWINAVPDTGQQDIRVVDIPTNAGLFDADFRAFNQFYQPIEAGSRTVRIFLSSTDPTIAKQMLQETTLPLTENAGYTFIHAGFARGGPPARSVLIIPDAPPAPAAGQIGVRAINVGAGLGDVDVWFVKHPVNPATVDSLPDTRTFGALTFGGASAYVTMPRDSATTDSVRVVVTAAGTKTPILATVKAPAGDPGTPGSPTGAPIAGARVAGSVLSVVLVPRSVAGSQAPAAFTTPTAFYLVDRRP